MMPSIPTISYQNVIQNEVFFVKMGTLFCCFRKKMFLCSMKPILTITGSDSTSGSGVQADIKTISELGGYAMSAITSITVQTTLGIQQFYDLPASIVKGQIEAIMNDFQPEVVKIGLIRTNETLNAVVSAIQKYRPRHVILDAVVSSSQGETLVEHKLVEAIANELLPLCTLVIEMDEKSMHGLANRYASAVAVYLSQGQTTEQAQALARSYINNQVAKTSDLQGRSSELYNEFLNAVSEYHRSNRDVHFYADKLNVSSRYLAQVTRRISDKAPKTIIDDFLMQEIERQLKFTDNTIQEIAYALGFSSQAHFTKFFKKQRGCSPTIFRKQ